MNRFCIVLFPVFLVLFVGCGRQTATLSAGQFDENAPGDSLCGIRIPVSGDFLGEYPIMVIDDHILMDNPYMAEKQFSVYRYSGDTLKKEGEFLRRGRGPNESGIAKVSFDPNTRELGMLSPYNMENRFSRVRLEPFENLYDISTWEYKPLPFIGQNSFAYSSLIEGSTYLMLGYCADSLQMFSLLDVDKEQVVPLDLRYPEMPIELTSLYRSMYWGGMLWKHPHKNRFLYSAQDFRHLFVFDVEAGNHVQVVRNIYDELPKVHPINNDRHYSFDDTCEVGCNLIAVDNDYIYVSYSHKTYGQIREAARAGKSLSMFNPRRINVYDWDGNFVRRLVLDMPVGPMVVVGDQLITTSIDPETAEDFFVRYPLK